MTLTAGHASDFGSLTVKRIKIGSEEIDFNTDSGNNLTSLTRAVNGTSIATHSIGAEVVSVSTTFYQSMALGNSTLSSLNGSSKNNLAVGISSLSSLSFGKRNTVIGFQSGDAITTGNNNTLLGTGSGSSGTYDLTTGDNNTIIGYNAAASAANVNNEITLGNSSVDALRCADTTITSVSDQRDKTNIVDSTYGLSFVESIRPVQFTWNRRNLVEGDTNNSHNGKTRVGFIAQELQSAMPNNDNEILDLVYESNPDRLEAKYGNLIPVLTKAIQELKQANDVLTARVAALESA